VYSVVKKSLVKPFPCKDSRPFQIKIHQSGGYGLFGWNVVICTFFGFIRMKETEIVLLIEMKGTGIVVCIYYQEATTGLVVFMPKPVFDELHQLTAYIHSLKFFIDSNSSNQRCRITASAFGIVNRTVQTVSGSLVQMQGLDAVIGKCKECYYAVRFLLGYPTIGFTHQFFCIPFGIIVEKIIKVCIPARKRQTTFPYYMVEGKHDALVE